MRILTTLAVLLTMTACGGGEPVPADHPAPPDNAVDGTLPGMELPADTAALHNPELRDELPVGPGTAPGTGGTGTIRPGATSTGQQNGGAAAPIVTAPGAAQPQQPDGAVDGAAVLQRAAAAYDQVNSLRANFVVVAQNPLLRQTTTSRGRLYQRHPDRLALRFTDPEGDLILSDGQSFWMYYPSINAQQVTRCPASAAGESAVNLRAQFVGNPTERFNHTSHGTESVNGRPAHVFTLTPRQRGEYRSLRVWIDTRDFLVRRFEITEHNGVTRRFDLDALEVNVSVPDATFRFTPPAGVREICA